MATVENYKDKLLQGYVGDRVPNLGTGIVEWEDIRNTEGHKPEDDATLGAEFDVNLDGLANTHNIANNAVTDSIFKETWDYVIGTKTMSIDVDISPANGTVVLFVSALFKSNHSATSGVSRMLGRIKLNGITLLQGYVIDMPSPTGSNYFEMTFSDKYAFETNQTNDDIFLITDKGTFLGTNNDDYLVAAKTGYDTDSYTVELDYETTSDGTAGDILHMSVYAQVLKR